MQTLTGLSRKYLLVPKLLCFSISMQNYALHKFRPLFAKDMFEIKEDELGWVGVLLFVTFFTNVLLATMNDRFRRPKTFIVGLLSVSCFFFQLFYVEGYMKINRFMFWINLFAYLASNTATLALLDKIILDHLSKHPDMSSKVYGRQRIWATIGYILGTFIIERILGRIKTETGDKLDFTNLKYYSLVTTLIGVILTIALVEEPGDGGRTSTHNILAGWRELMRNRDYLFFIFITLLNGFTRSGMTLYLPNYIKYVLRVRPYSLPAWWPVWIRRTIGVFNDFPFSTITVFEASLEGTILFYSQLIIHRIGLYWPLGIAQMSQALRFILYLILPCTHPHVFIFCCMFEVLKGINFGLTQASGVQLAERLCPPHLKTTSQMIYNGTFTAIGSVVSGPLLGLIFKGNEGNASEQIISSFRMFFIFNTLVAATAIALFFFKYGFVDGELVGIPSIRRKETQIKASRTEDRSKEMVEKFVEVS